MKQMMKWVLVTVLSIFMMGQAVANVPEKRIVVDTASDEKWESYLAILAEIPAPLDGKMVKGYDPATGLVHTAAVLKRVCARNEKDQEWKKACAKQGDLYTEFYARNGWKELLVSQADLRKQFQSGLYVPFKVAMASTGATTSPVLPGGPAEPAASAAPTVAPVQQPAAVASTTSASTPTTPAMTADEVKEIATKAFKDVNAQATAVLSGQLAIRDEKIAKLQAQIAQAVDPQVVGELKRQLKDLSDQRNADARALKEAQEGLKETKASLDTQVAKLPATAAAAAASAVQPLVAGVRGEISNLKKDVDSRVNDLAGQVQTGTKWNGALIGGLAFALILSALALAHGLKLASSARSRAQAVDNNIDQLKKSVKKDVDEVKAELDTFGRVNQRLDNAVAGLKSQAGRLDQRVSDTEVRVSSLEADRKVFDFDDAQLITELRYMFTGTKKVFDFTVDGVSHQVEFEKGDVVESVLIHGIRDQTEPVKVANVPGRIKRAANKGDLVGLMPATSAPTLVAVA